MVDDRVVVMSSNGYRNLVNPSNGKGLHWICDINAELPVKITLSGPGSERPTTLPQMFISAVKSGGDRVSMLVERDNKVLTWTWNQYYADAMAFAKACSHLKVNEKSSVAIMGCNTPEWAIAFTGGIMYNLVASGIYQTNAPEACLYQVDHCEAEIIVVENTDMLNRFLKHGKDKIKRVKAFVVFAEKAIPAEIQDSRVYLWNDFMKIGKSVPNDVIIEKCLRQKPGECCVLIYTSGTTGMPKGCMISHDNLSWGTIQVMETASRERPDLIGP
jgi:long-chain-fatty-acid--CoA ligase ACSBG